MILSRDSSFQELCHILWHQTAQCVVHVGIHISPRRHSINGPETMPDLSPCGELICSSRDFDDHSHFQVWRIKFGSHSCYPSLLHALDSNSTCLANCLRRHMLKSSVIIELLELANKGSVHRHLPDSPIVLDPHMWTSHSCLSTTTYYY